MARDAGTSPVGDAFRLDAVICGLADDLDALRAGRITIDDARVRAALGKQIFNGVRLVINARRALEAGARPVGIGGSGEAG